MIYSKKNTLKIPAYINLSLFIESISRDLDVDILFFQKKSPIRILRKKGVIVEIESFGPDSDIFRERLDLFLDDFLEASGFLG